MNVVLRRRGLLMRGLLMRGLWMGLLVGRRSNPGVRNGFNPHHLFLFLLRDLHYGVFEGLGNREATAQL